MKQIKLNGFQKLVCFSLAAILCVALLGFAVGGLQTDNSKLPNDSGNVSDTTDKTDENKGENQRHARVLGDDHVQTEQHTQMQHHVHD